MPCLHAGKAYDLVRGILAVQDRAGSFWTRSLYDDPTAPSSAMHFAGLGIDSDTFEDFLIDPTQNLLVVLYHSAPDLAILPFLTLSRHEPHPKARHPTLTFKVDSYPLQLSMEIAHNILGACTHLPGRLRIWNWHKGELIANLSNRRGNFPSFQFLSPRAFVLGVSGMYSRIDIYVIQEGSPGRAVRAAALGLPEINDPWFLRAIEIHSGPFCAHGTECPFVSDNSARIYLFWMEYTHDSVHEHSYVHLFVHHRTLHHYVSRYLQEGRTSHFDVLWNQWGPQSTRILEATFIACRGLGTLFPIFFVLIAFRNVHGERAIFPSPDGNSLHLLDFDVFPGHPELDSGIGTLIMGPGTLSGGNMPFKEKITTCRRTTREMDEGVEAFINVMDQDHLVGVSRSINDHMTVFTFR